MKPCQLVIQDEVNVKFVGLDVTVRNKLSAAVRFFLPHARHTPAYKLGRWDGYVRFCDIGGRTYLHLLEKLLPIVVESGYDVSVVDNRDTYNFEFEEIDEAYLSHITWPEGHQCAGQPIMLNQHQVSAINDYLQNLHGMQSIATGAGKTVITAVLSKMVEKYGKTIVVVPSVDLVTQTIRDYKLLGLDVGEFHGGKKAPATHTICTWQSIESLFKKSKELENDELFTETFGEIVCVIIDECHTVRGDVLFKHLTQHFKNVPIRWGMTGTVPKSDHEATTLSCALGPIIGKVSAKTLQERGLLSKLDIEVLQLNDPPMTRPNGKKAPYSDEAAKLANDKYRIGWLAKHIQQQAEDGSNILILVSKLNTGKMLQKMIPNSIFVSGSVASKSRKVHYDEVKQGDGIVTIATYGVAAVGIDIPRIFKLYLYEAGKSFIRVIQSIGRGIRVAKDKNYAKVFDVCSTLPYSKQHLTERKKFYNEAEYPFQIKKVDYLNEYTHNK